MSQPSKGKPTRDPQKGDAKSGVSVKQGVGTAAGASEVKTKAGKVDTSKPASLASKQSTKPGVTAQKTTDPSKHKGKQIPKMEPGSKTNPTAKQATSSANSSGTKPKDTVLGKTTTIKPSGTTGEKQSHSPAAGIQKGKMVPGKTSDTSKDVKQSRNIHAANGNSVRFKEKIHQKHLEDVMKIVADMKSQIMSEVSLMIGEEINSLKGTIIKSLESTSIDQKGAVIASLKNASVMEGKMGAHPEEKPKSLAREVLKDKALADALDFNLAKSDTSISAPPPTYSQAASSKQKEGKADDHSAVDALSDMLQPQGPVDSGHKWTGPAVTEKTAVEKNADKVGEREDSLPPGYRLQPEDTGKKDTGVGAQTYPAEKPKPLKQDDLMAAMASDFTQSSPDLITKAPAPSSHSAAPIQKKDQIEPVKASAACSVSSSQPAPKAADKKGPAVAAPTDSGKKPEAADKKGPAVAAPTDSGKKPELSKKIDVMDNMASDFRQSSPATITKSAVESSHAAPPMQKKDQIKPVSAPTVCSVSASKCDVKGKTGDVGGLDALSDMLAPEAPVHSGPIYTGPEVKEKSASKKLADKVGEREDSLPPDYRDYPKETNKKGPAVSAPTDPAKKPELLTNTDLVDAMAFDFMQSSQATITKSAAASSHTEAPMLKKDQVEPVRASAACSVSSSTPAPKDKTGDMGAFDELSDMLLPDAPAHLAPEYTGPEVKEKAAHEKLANKVGEREDSIPPDYRFKSEVTDKKGPAVAVSTDKAKEPEQLTPVDLMEAMVSDFAQSSPAIITQSAAASSQAAPPKQTENQIEPVQTSAAYSVSASQPALKGQTKDIGSLDKLSDMLLPEASAHSGPKYTGPKVKEKAAHEKHANKVGEREDSIPPDYRFKSEDTNKKGPAAAVSTDTAKKPEIDLVGAMASDFMQSSPAITAKSTTAFSHTAPPMLTKDQIEPVKSSAACSVSASKPAPKGKIGDMGAYDALSDMLQPEAPAHSEPKYTGLEVKEKTAHEKLAYKVGEREDSLPPDYQFKPEGTDKKGSAVAAPTDPVKKPELLAKDDFLDTMASDFIQCSPVAITKSAAAPSHSAAPVLKKDQSELVKTTAASSVSASQSAAQGKIGDMVGLDELSDMLQPESQVHSGPKYTGPEVQEKSASEKLANKVGEREDSIPPDYRFKPEGTDKKGPVAGAGIESTKKSKMSEAQLMDAMSLDFGQNTETLMDKSQTGGAKPKKVVNKPGDIGIEILPTSPKSPKSPTSPTSPTKAKDTASKSAKAKEHTSTNSGSKKSRKR